MPANLTNKMREALELLADANGPMIREEIMRRLRMKSGFSKLFGAATRPKAGIQEGNNLLRREFVQNVGKYPLRFIITPRGLAEIGRKNAKPGVKAKTTVPAAPRPKRAESAKASSPRQVDELPQADFLPIDEDLRKTVEKLVKERRGQPKFRQALLARYGEACLISGCQDADVLEAAHIVPYQGEYYNHPANGLLLRADLHTLFDLDKIGIEPDSLRVHVHRSVKDKTYRDFHGEVLRCSHSRPSQAALIRKWEQFSTNNGSN